MTHTGVRCKKSSVAHKAPESCKLQVSKLTMVFVLIGFVACAGIMYIFQVNKLATMGYEIRERENKIELLKKQNENLQIKAAELRSMKNLEMDKEHIKMQKPSSISYIEVDGPVAMK